MFSKVACYNHRNVISTIVLSRVDGSSDTTVFKTSIAISRVAYDSKKIKIRAFKNSLHSKLFQFSFLVPVLVPHFPEVGPRTQSRGCPPRLLPQTCATYMRFGGCFNALLLDISLHSRYPLALIYPPPFF